jgi:hypothetical protein
MPVIAGTTGRRRIFMPANFHPFIGNELRLRILEKLPKFIIDSLCSKVNLFLYSKLADPDNYPGIWKEGSDENQNRLFMCL